MPPMMTQQEQINAHARVLRKMDQRMAQLAQINAQQAQDIAELKSRPRSITEEIDAIPGRRIDTIFSGEVEFTLANLGQVGLPITIRISQDGPFIMTHYPMAIWRPSAPDNTTNLGRWRPVSSFPLPTQQIGTDIIDIGYFLEDGGSQRYFQNEMRGPVLSRPDNIVPCAVPTEWAPNATIKFTPEYLAISFNGTVPPTAGILHVDLIGYRIVNL